MKKLIGLSSLLPMLILVPVLLIVIVFSRGDTEMNLGGEGTLIGVNAETLAFKEPILKEMQKQQLDKKWLNLLLAHVMQESHGGLLSDDIFQCSESLGLPPNSLGVKESIVQGVSFFKAQLKVVASTTGHEPSPTNEGDVNISSVLYQFPSFGPWLKKERNGKWSEEANYYFYKNVVPGFGAGPGDKDYFKNILKYYDCNSGNLVGGGTGKYIIPVDNPIVSSGFVDRINPVTGQREQHKGLDFAQPMNSAIKAADDGVVVFAGMGSNSNGFNNYGNVVLLEHPKSKEWTLYAHQNAVSVTKGQKVKQGQVIGKVGSTGQSTGAHLHFEIRKQQWGGQIDPAPILGVNGK
ncbi:M23 family metallopeptidase [Brochothrix thermosphacta]|uniref:M23 family metallopeptidase n=1 Tax=Brochothrix thermosphacta TaxID=2756 RepID=UPI003F94DA3C